MTMDDFAPKLQPIEVILQMPEPSFWVVFGPYAIALAAVITVSITYLINHQNRKHNEEQENKKNRLEKLEKIYEFFDSEVNKSFLKFKNHVFPKDLSQGQAKPFNETFLLKSTIYITPYFPELEIYLSNLIDDYLALLKLFDESLDYVVKSEAYKTPGVFVRRNSTEIIAIYEHYTNQIKYLELHEKFLDTRSKALLKTMNIAKQIVNGTYNQDYIQNREKPTT